MPSGAVNRRPILVVQQVSGQSHPTRGDDIARAQHQSSPQSLPSHVRLMQLAASPCPGCSTLQPNPRIGRRTSVGPQKCRRAGRSDESSFTIPDTASCGHWQALGTLLSTSPTVSADTVGRSPQDGCSSFGKVSASSLWVGFTSSVPVIISISPADCRTGMRKGVGSSLVRLPPSTSRRGAPFQRGYGQLSRQRAAGRSAADDFFDIQGYR